MLPLDNFKLPHIFFQRKKRAEKRLLLFYFFNGHDTDFQQVVTFTHQHVLLDDCRKYVCI